MRLLLTPLLCLLATASPSSPGLDVPLSDAELRKVVITLDRGGCYGDCPIYDVRITGDGKVQYHGTHFVEATGARSSKILRSDVRKLVGVFEKAGYFSIGRDYTYETCSTKACGFSNDAASATTSIRVRGKTYKVSHSFGCRCAPKGLFDVEAAIDGVGRTVRWVGTEQGGQRAGSSN